MVKFYKAENFKYDVLFCAKRFEEDISIFGWSLFSVMRFAVIVVVLKENFVIAALRLGLYCAAKLRVYERIFSLL